MNARDASLRVSSTIGAAVGYGCLAVFLYLVAVQICRWFRDGEWTHIGMSDGMRIGLQYCCSKESDHGRIAALLGWLDAPMDWLGLHRVFELVPASLALFAASIAGNCLFIYSRDRLRKPAAARSAA